MPAEIVTGYAGEPHVTAAQDGRRNAGAFGPGRYVLATGEQLALTVDSSNVVTVKTGDAVMDGRHVTVETATSLQVESGTQGVGRHDLVCIRYAIDPTTKVETAELVVVQGTPGTSPVDPAYSEGTILEGATVVDWPIYRLELNNIALTPVPLFRVVAPMAALEDRLRAVEGSYRSASNLNAGTLAVARGGTGAATASPNRMLAGPASGTDAAAPSWRTLVAADVPPLPASKIASGTLAAARLPSASTSASGIMSAADKAKLDQIAINSNIYLTPTSGDTRYRLCVTSAGNIRLDISTDGGKTYSSDAASGSLYFSKNGHAHDASDISGGTLAAARLPVVPTSKGGTGLTTNPSMLVNLASGSAAGVLQASPRPGVTGKLAVGHGGTGATSAQQARINLGMGYEAGDVIQGTIDTAGYVTNGGKNFCFVIPMMKQLEASTVRLTRLTLTARQNDHYLVGSGSGSTDVTGVATFSRNAHGLGVVVKMASAHASVVNNSPVGIVAAYTLTLS